jgi:hypothetical protein
MPDDLTTTIGAVGKDANRQTESDESIAIDKPAAALEQVRKYKASRSATQR